MQVYIISVSWYPDCGKSHNKGLSSPEVSILQKIPVFFFWYKKKQTLLMPSSTSINKFFIFPGFSKTDFAILQKIPDWSLKGLFCATYLMCCKAQLTIHCLATLDMDEQSIQKLVSQRLFSRLLSQDCYIREFVAAIVVGRTIACFFW